MLRYKSVFCLHDCFILPTHIKKKKEVRLLCNKNYGKQHRIRTYNLNSPHSHIWPPRKSWIVSNPVSGQKNSQWWWIFNFSPATCFSSEQSTELMQFNNSDICCPENFIALLSSEVIKQKQFNNANIILTQKPVSF